MDTERLHASFDVKSTTVVVGGMSFMVPVLCTCCLHLHAQVDEFHLGQLDWVDEAREGGAVSTNTSHSVYVQVVALSLGKLHLRKRHVENVFCAQSAGLHLNKDVVSQIIPTQMQGPSGNLTCCIRHSAVKYELKHQNNSCAHMMHGHDWA